MQLFGYNVPFREGTVTAWANLQSCWVITQRATLPSPNKMRSPWRFHGGKSCIIQHSEIPEPMKGETSLLKRVLTLSAFLADPLLDTSSTLSSRNDSFPYKALLFCSLYNTHHLLKGTKWGEPVLPPSHSLWFKLSRGPYHWRGQGTISSWNHILKTNPATEKQAGGESGAQCSSQQLQERSS